MALRSSTPSASRLAWLVGLVPVFPPLYLAALGALRLWRELPEALKRVLWVFIGLQGVSGLFTPEPLLSVPLALLRGAFIAAMLCAGVYLSKTRALYALMWGELATLGIALLTTLERHGFQFWTVRLEHPVYWPVSIGLAASIVFLFAFVREDFSRALRGGLISAAVLGLLLSGSRAAEAAAFLGALAICALVRQGRLWRRLLTSTLIAVALSLVIAALTPGKTDVGDGKNPIGRSVEVGLDLNGRDIIWSQAWKAFLEHPVGGVGTYQIGPYIPQLLLPCKLFPPVEPFGPCPPLLEKLNGAWNIAHNFLLHGLTETGVLGALAWLLLLGYLGLAALRSKEPVLLGLWVAYMTVNMVDNSTLVPSPHFAEAFYVAMGVAAARALASGSQREQGAPAARPAPLERPEKTPLEV